MEILLDGTRVRLGVHKDQPQIAKLLELNDLSRWIAYEETFLVAERDGRVLAALRYRTEEKRLLLGLLVADPWAREGDLAVALYAGVRQLAREMGIREVLARTIRYGNWSAGYPYGAGYRRVMGGWYLDATQPLDCRRELPTGGWGRKIALLGMVAIPFFTLGIKS